MNHLIVFGLLGLAAIVMTYAFSAKRLSNACERGVIRKWCCIWSAGVFLLVLLPGLLVSLQTMPDKLAGIFPALYVVFFGPTVAWYTNEMRAANNKRQDNNDQRSDAET